MLSVWFGCLFEGRLNADKNGSDLAEARASISLGVAAGGKSCSIANRCSVLMPAIGAVNLLIRLSSLPISLSKGSLFTCLTMV